MVENSDTHYITLFILLFAIGSILAIIIAGIVISVSHKKHLRKKAENASVPGPDQSV